MRPSFLCAIILGLALTILPATASNWLIVAVPQASGKNGQVLNISQPFQVILTNTTLHDLKLWNEWSSKGYFNLCFEFQGSDGKITKVEKNPHIFWFKHSPEEITVQPGCAYTIPVDFSNAKEWTGVKSLNGKMNMRVVYENARSEPLHITIAR